MIMMISNQDPDPRDREPSYSQTNTHIEFTLSTTRVCVVLGSRSSIRLAHLQHGALGIDPRKPQANSVVTQSTWQIDSY